MKCSRCGSEITVYDLYPRSYRLYIYLCRRCRAGFLAHHFDVNLDIYQMSEIKMKENGDLIFLTGLKVEPRVFDFKLSRELDAIVVADETASLGELAKTDKYVYAPYSQKALKRVCMHTRLEQGSSLEQLAEKVGEAWEAAR